MAENVKEYPYTLKPTEKVFQISPLEPYEVIFHVQHP